MSYEALIGYWNGACFEMCERCTLDSETPEEAIAEVEAMAFDSSEDYDIQVTIEDEGGDTIYTKHFENSVARNQQDDMDESWCDEGEFSTDHLGVKNGEWYIWSSNGGSRGSHDRMDGSGRWIEQYEKPAKVSPADALNWMVKNLSVDADEALDVMEDADSEHTKADLAREIGDCLWQEDQLVGVYRVCGGLYTVDIYDCMLVENDEAVKFVSDRDECAVEGFKKTIAAV